MYFTFTVLYNVPEGKCSRWRCVFSDENGGVFSNDFVFHQEVRCLMESLWALCCEVAFIFSFYVSLFPTSQAFCNEYAEGAVYLLNVLQDAL